MKDGEADATDAGLTAAQARSRALTRAANALRAQGRWEDALPLAQEAYQADPANGAAAHNLSVLLTKLGRLAEGEGPARRALAIAPQSAMVAHALAHNLLGQGRLEEAWPFYEARALLPDLNTGFPTEFPFARWRGEPFAGKRLTVFPEQGLGDQIQFSRFLPRLIAEAEAVTLLVMPHLERLFRHNFPKAQFVVADGATEFPDPDFWTTLHDLPAALKIGLKDIDGRPYLTAPGAWPSLGEGFKVGLKTRGNPRHLNDALRSLTPADEAALRARLPGRIVSLEPADSGASDMADTAAIIDQLDLIVSVDTSVAHLAGAMGKPCLLLIPGFGADWRWMQDRADSPWYEGHRLYRSSIRGDWSEAIEQIVADAGALERRLAMRSLVEQAEMLGYRGDPTRALALAEQATAQDPDNVRAAYTKAILLSLGGRLPEAEDLLRRIVAAAPQLPEARHALGVNLLGQGRYREGWPLYDARTALENANDGFPRDFPFPRWRGEDLRGKAVVVFPEQGIGDQIQFARFIPALSRLGADVTLLAAPPLKRLFEQSFADINIVSAQGSAEFADPDYWMTLADLPGQLDVTLEDIPTEPYLRCANGVLLSAENFRIGFMPRGSSGYRFDVYRSLGEEATAQLAAQLPGEVVSLAPEETGARDFLDTAAIISGLDLVVSVDTAVAHLAGAMGKPCLLLLPGFATDWRWMRGRDTSPWYPRHRLYRGAIDGGWGEAIDRLIGDARTFAAAKGGKEQDAGGWARFPTWRGEDITGRRVVILPDQAIATTIQMARFLPQLRARGAQLTWLVQPQLAELLRTSFPTIEQLAAAESVEFSDPDFVVTLAELPRALGITLPSIRVEPYLIPPQRWDESPIGFKTGLAVWCVDDGQQARMGEQISALRTGLPGTIVDLESGQDSPDLGKLAAMIAEVDVLVATEGVAAHLAGAMGKPCLLLIETAGADRLAAVGDRTPWYPQHRLFTKLADAGWGDAIDALLQSVRSLRNPTRLLAREAIDLRDRGRIDEAMLANKAALAADPHNTTALHNLARLLTDIGRLKEGEAADRRALSIAPKLDEARFGLALNLLAQGRFSEAWPYYEARTRLPQHSGRFPSETRIARWRGEDLSGQRIAIFPEQGFGDQIQFARFIPWLSERCAAIVLFAPMALAGLFRQAFPTVQMIVAEGDASFPKCVFWTTLIELAAHTGVGPFDLPAGDYLRSTSRDPCPGAFRIGIMTNGSATYANDAHRSLTEADANGLRSRLPGRLVELDPTKSGAGDFADTAAIMADLDLIVSVDTAVGHLAGAMGKPCLLLVPGFATDWRWMRERRDSPWYPRHQLFRGGVDGNWRLAIDALVEEAQRRANGPEPAPQLGIWDEALRLSHEAVARTPTSSTSIRQLGTLLTKVGKLREGENALRTAIALADGDAAKPKYQLALNLLGQGRYREAWPLHAARRELEDLSIGYPRNIQGPRWEGQDLTGQRLLVLGEQGLGDTLQLARFLPELAARGATVTLCERPHFTRLLQASFPAITVISDPTRIGPQDYWTTTFDMLEPLDLNLDWIPAAEYVDVRPSGGRAPAGFAIGLCASGNQKHLNDRYRSLPASVARQLSAALPGSVIDLLPEQTGARDFADTAAIMAKLDLIISVDTSVAHLAGAMGKPCLLLLPGFGTDWRWLLERSDSPWYPQHHLYRSGVDGSWQEAIDQVLAEVRRREAADTPVTVASGDRRPSAQLQALDAAQIAARQRPDDAIAIRHLGMLLTLTGRLEEGEDTLARALQLGLSPDLADRARYGLAINLLQQGRFDEGWALHAVRRGMSHLQIGYPRDVPFTRWAGGSLAGRTLLVLPEQGLGDQIQFARFLPALVERGARVRAFVHPTLVTLFRASFQGVDVQPAHNGASLGEADYWTTFVDLLEFFVRSSHDMRPEPYMRVDPSVMSATVAGRVAVHLAGNPTHHNDRFRSLPDDVAAHLRSQLPGTVIDLDPQVTGAADFSDTAALIDGADLVIAVDSAVAHLAGAMGKDCLLLIPGYATDWRWLAGRNDSPWYPRHKLYRASVEGDWSEAVSRVIADVQAWHRRGGQHRIADGHQSA